MCLFFRILKLKKHMWMNGLLMISCHLLMVKRKVLSYFCFFHTYLTFFILSSIKKYFEKFEPRLYLCYLPLI